MFLGRVQEDKRTLRISRDTNGGLHLIPLTDGPFVVTHLAAYGTSEAEKAAAVLPEPIAITDSAGAYIGPDTIKKLVWRSGITGEQVPVPPRANIVALYYRPRATVRPQARP